MADASAAAPTAQWSGHLDIASRELIAGWSWDAGRPHQPVALQVLDNGELIARVLANRYRPDLETAGLAKGGCAFQVRVPGGLAPHIRHIIHVQREADGKELPGSPKIVEPSTGFDAAFESSMTRVIDSLLTGPALDHVLAFLATQTDKLLQRRADAEGQRAEREAHRAFRRRWGPRSPPTDAATTLPDGATDPGLRALVIDDLFPVAARDAGSQALLSHMAALQELGYTVSFVASTHGMAAAPAVATLERLGIACYHTPHYASVEEVLRRQAYCFDLVYLHRISNASSYLALARKYFPKARILYSVADLHHLRFARQAEVEARPELMKRSWWLRQQEDMAARSAHAVLTHSPHEAAVLRDAVAGVNVHVVSWGLPLRPVTVPLAQRSGVAFIGGYGYSPNVDAAWYLAEEIMPLVWQHDPGITCFLVGSDMPNSISRLARPGLVPVGQLADLAEIFERVRLTVAPLRYGAGIKGKVLASLAAGIPCIMTPIAAEGLALSADTAETCVGATAAELAERIIRLHTDPAAHHNAAKAGLHLIEAAFQQPTVTAALKAAIASAKP